MEMFLNVKDPPTASGLTPAVGDGVADDTSALNAAFANAITHKLAVMIPPGTYRTTAALRWNDPQPRIFGAGMTWSTIEPDATTYHGLHVGTGLEMGSLPGGGVIQDLTIKGPTERPTKTSTAGLFLDSVKAARVTNVQVSNHDIGFDMLHNCYGTRFENIYAFFSECNVGVNLRGLVNNVLGSGSDIVFINAWVSGEVAGVHISPAGTGYHFLGGQIRGGDAASSATVAPFVIGKDYETGATGNVGTVTLYGVDAEGWKTGTGAVTGAGYFFRSYGEVNVTVRAVAFLATDDSPSNKAVGILNATGVANSQWTFDGCDLSGHYTGSTLIAPLSGANDAFCITESGWRSGGPLTIAGVGAYEYSLLRQAQSDQGVSSSAMPGSYRTFQIGGLLLRHNWGSGAFEKSTDWGVNWSPV